MNTPLDEQMWILQHLQSLVQDRDSRVTLAEVASLVQRMQQEYGTVATLEHVIQVLAAKHLRLQIEHKRQEVAA